MKTLMTRKNLDLLGDEQIHAWLIAAGWELRPRDWRIVRKNTVTLTNYQGAIDIQLRRDAQRLGVLRASTQESR